MTKFSVNLNKIALLRNSRGRNVPDVAAVARRCLDLGVHGITVHPRPDERHTRYADVVELARVVREFPGAEFNVEGNPTESFIALVLQARPDQVTLVPDTAQQLTSDHGWNVLGDAALLSAVVPRFRDAGIRTSLFVDPDVEQIEAVGAVQADRIELYTESYASAHGSPDQERVLGTFAAAARAAHAQGLGVNAGHDLSLDNLEHFLARVPGVLEVSIGHAVVCEALELGLRATLERYLVIVNAAGTRSESPA
ncbi:MAG TPA: pyridoxine 5'-phosphate synthase [Polyangiaceae bacterium]|nr:pyridoxine 5'-phosphate synthase [Polyangiaceae bacterium]